MQTANSQANYPSLILPPTFSDASVCSPIPETVSFPVVGVPTSFVSRDTKDVEFLDTPTSELYIPLQRAYQYFDLRLFDEELLPVILTVRKKGKHCPGFYVPVAFETRNQNRDAAEIAINSAIFDRPLIVVLAVLVHQMVHHWQHQQGQASRPTYHNLEWSQKMTAIGLQPSSSGIDGGKAIGQSMDQYVIPGGLFERACADLIGQGLEITWLETITDSVSASPKPQKKKSVDVIWTCPTCNARAKAAQSVSFSCICCQLPLVRAELD